MFNGPNFPEPLDEGVFDDWLKEGRSEKAGCSHLLIIWDELDSRYKPVYAENRGMLEEYERYPSLRSRESMVAAYDLYSETRIA